MPSSGPWRRETFTFSTDPELEAAANLDQGRGYPVSWPFAAGRVREEPRRVKVRR